MIFSACSKRCVSELRSVSGDRLEDSLKESEMLDRIMRQEAMLVNIPLPLYNERILSLSCESPKDDTIVLGYKSPLMECQIVDFFLNQMERYGWKHIVSFDGFESILQFENPDSYCTVVIRSLESHSSSLFIYIKKASIDARFLGSELG